MDKYKRKLEAQLDHPPQRIEVFTSCYKKKVDCSWSGSPTEEVAETYQKKQEERASQVTPLEECGSSTTSVTPFENEQLWTKATRRKKRGQVFGMGSEAFKSDAASSWPKDHRASTSSATSPPEPSISTQLQEIKLMLSILLDKMGIQMLRPNQPPAADAPS